MTTPDEPQYNSIGQKYDAITDLPCNKLEQELIRSALGDCTGLKILDLAGGTGLKALQAIYAGAAAVHVVDISSAMVEAAAARQETLGNDKGRIQAYVADCSKPLADQGLSVLEQASYDIVMAHWLFEYAQSPEDLRAMWQNIAAYLKPERSFLGIRSVWGVDAEYLKEGLYGAVVTQMEKTEDGCKYRVRFKTEPPVEFCCTPLRSSLSLDETIPRELGLTDFAVVEAEEPM